jgi:hypothetical protein
MPLYHYAAAVIAVLPPPTPMLILFIYATLRHWLIDTPPSRLFPPQFSDTFTSFSTWPIAGPLYCRHADFLPYAESSLVIFEVLISPTYIFSRFSRRSSFAAAAITSPLIIAD